MNQPTETELRSIGYQHGLSGQSLIKCPMRDDPTVRWWFDRGRERYKEANKMANFPIPDSDLMGAPRRHQREKSS